jgi:N-acetylglutamate synthase-like GNAT family acetyltransferase
MSRVDPASSQDLIAIRALLERAGLPTSDLESAQPEFVVIRADGKATAAGALQRFGSSALLRSLVVAPDHRGNGLGRLIVSELEYSARAAQITELILLTQTAAEFFARQGYRAIERQARHKPCR